jgi:hypothetical protein
MANLSQIDADASIYMQTSRSMHLHPDHGRAITPPVIGIGTPVVAG